MGNCVGLHINNDNKCYFCNKDLSYRYLKCDKCNINMHYNCAYNIDKNSRKCSKCNKKTLRPLLDNEIDPCRRNTI